MISLLRSKSAYVEPLLPPATTGGRPRTSDLRKVLSHCLYCLKRLPVADAAKRLSVKSRKRHIITNTLGLILHVIVHTADIEDRNGASNPPKAIRYRYPWLRHVFADGCYAGAKLRGALDRQGNWTIKIIKRSDTAKGFEVLPRQSIVERALAWIGRYRRRAKDWQNHLHRTPRMGSRVMISESWY